MFPKPKIKKRKIFRNPRPTDQDFCEICGKPYAETHEVFGGKSRQASIKYNMQIRLCAECHRGQNGVHFNPILDKTLKMQYQRKFEDKYGHEKFMKIFGRNYL